METSAQIAAYLTPEGIKQTPIVTERTITNKDNRIRLGESLVIGGIRKSEKRDVIRGVPILKDIPVLGWLFSGRDFEERATEVIFILTPSISTKGKPNKDMVEMLKDRHASPASRGLSETVMDPLGTKARREDEERRLEKARIAQQESEAEMTAAASKPSRPASRSRIWRPNWRRTRPGRATDAETQQAQVQAKQATAEAQQVKAELQRPKRKTEKPPEAKPNENKSDKPKEEPKPAGPTPTPPPQGGAPSAQPPQQK